MRVSSSSLGEKIQLETPAAVAAAFNNVFVNSSEAVKFKKRRC